MRARRPRSQGDGSAGGEALDESLMLRRGEALLEDGDQPGSVVADQGRWVEPQAGKLLAAQDAVLARREWLVPVAAKDEPVDRSIQDAPGNIFPDTTLTV